MAIAVTGTKRIKDGLYVQVSLSGDAKDYELAAVATVAGGAEVPVRALRGDDEGEWLVALACLAVTQTVKLTAMAWEGEATEELTYRYNPLISRLPLPARALGSKRLVAEARVPSSRDALGEWDVQVDRLVTTRDGLDVCQGHATLVGTGAQAVEGDVLVRALDSHGRDAAADAWVCLSDLVYELPSHPGFFERRVEFSLRVPTTATTLVVWVVPQNDANLPTGFVCLGARVAEGIRELWRIPATDAMDDEAYDAWYATSHAASNAELSMQQDGSFGQGLLFSVVSVLHDATPDQLREMVDSVLEQSYGRLELVLVNAAPDDRRLASAVRGLELADARVKCVPLAADFGIAAATSEGVDAATGDFVCLLDEGDLLSPDALWCLASVLDEDPDTDLMYTDQDSIEHGHHVRPCFKPDWDHDLQMGCNYVGSLLAVRASLLHDMETMGTELDGAQSYHIALYAAERAQKVRHVPRVLYHARQLKRAPKEGAAASAAGLVALRKHLEAMGADATARPSTRVPQGYEVQYGMGEEQPLVSVVIVNHDGVAALDRCLTSLRELTEYENYEVIIVEQGSTQQQTFDYYRQAEEADARVRTIFYQGNNGNNHARLVNFGASRAKGSYLLLLSPDTEVVDGGWMGRMVSLCMRKDTAAVGARLSRPDGTILFSGAFLSTRGPVYLDRYRLVVDCTRPCSALLHKVSIASEACLMVDAQVFAALEGMSTAYASCYGDADLCLRMIGRGYRVVVDPQVLLTCYRALSGDVNDRSTKRLQAVGRLWQSWPYGASSVDPTVGPNVDHRSPYRTLRGRI